MKTTIVLFLLVVGSAVCRQGFGANGRQIALPNSNLMRCESARLWQDEKIGAEAVYPLRLSVDHFDKDGCPQGIVAVYDKAISIDDIMKALDRRYAKWGKADNGRIKLYRVEPEKFAIQLTTITDSLKETGTFGESGMKQVVYLSFDLSKSTGGRQ